MQALFDKTKVNDCECCDGECDTLACTKCKFFGCLEDFDDLGSCGDNVFCPKCHQEFSALDGSLHDARSCRVCIESGKR